MLQLLKYPLAPLLMLEGRRIRARAPRLPEPPGPRQGVAGEGRDLRLLILGDSAAAGVGAAHQSEAFAGRLVARLAERFRVRWELDAVTGATTADAIARLRTRPLSTVDVAVVVLGVNDVTSGIPRWLFRRRSAELHRLLRSRSGALLILRAGLPPMHAFPLLPRHVAAILGAEARRFDRALARLAAHDGGVTHVPWQGGLDPAAMASDGFHPGPPIYAAMAEALAAAIARDLPAASAGLFSAT